MPTLLKTMRILKSIVKCLSVENLERIKERLIFVVRAKDGESEEISTYSKSFEGGKSIDMTRVRLKSYEPLYQALLENQARSFDFHGGIYKYNILYLLLICRWLTQSYLVLRLNYDTDSERSMEIVCST